MKSKSALLCHARESFIHSAKKTKLTIASISVPPCSPSFKHYAKQAPFILPALSIAEVTLLPATKFEDNTIFNDLAFHRFPPQHDVPEVDLQDREEDPEML